MTGSTTQTPVPVPEPVDPRSPPAEADLSPTRFLDFEHPDVDRFARTIAATEAEGGLTGQAVVLFNTVRDSIWYDPHDISDDPDDYRASAVLGGRQRWCVPKAVLLTAACRVVGIPARLGFADVRNHLQSPKLRERMGTDLFYWHGYSVIWLDGAWRKASPAFNRELCERFGTDVLTFDGSGDALLHPYTGDGRRYMEYVSQRGVYSDLPLDRIMATFDEVYGFDAAPAEDDPAFRQG